MNMWLRAGACLALLLFAAGTLMAQPASSQAARHPGPDFRVTSYLSLDRGLAPGAYAWDETGVPPGPLRIVVDLHAERIYVYRNGIEIGRTFIIYGADNKPTPTGVFPILQKRRHHVSNLYHVPMPFMMRLTWDGIALHASDVGYNNATHGCIGLPDAFAALLFRAASIGDKVFVTRRWMPQVYGS